MEPLYYVMAILGCADNGTACEQARVEPVHYPSATQCRMAMTEALQRHSDLSYPVISAVCETSEQYLARAATAGERS